MKLTAKAIDLAHPADKEYMLSDGDKLYLRVHPSGGKRWLFNYMSVEGKRVKLTLGPYPEISLATARDLAAEQRRHLAMGKDPRVRQLEVRQEAQRQALAIGLAVAVGTVVAVSRDVAHDEARGASGAALRTRVRAVLRRQGRRSVSAHRRARAASLASPARPGASGRA